MKSILIICSLFLVSNTAMSFNPNRADSLKLKCTEANPEECNFISKLSSDENPISIEDITVYEVEEEVSFNFDTKQYLPEGFNPLKGIGDLDWDTINLVTLEEEVSFDFDTKQYLPEGFNPLKGIGDLDWSKIELIKLDEEVNINL